MSKTGPKFTEIDWNLVKKLSAIQCTRNEISSFLNISHDTLERAAKREFDCTIGEKMLEWAQGGCCSLRRSQWKLAETNATMCIFLGKQYLGQKDDYSIKNSGNLSMDIVHYGDGPAKTWNDEQGTK